MYLLNHWGQSTAGWWRYHEVFIPLYRYPPLKSSLCLAACITCIIDVRKPNEIMVLVLIEDLNVLKDTSKPSYIPSTKFRALLGNSGRLWATLCARMITIVFLRTMLLQTNKAFNVKCSKFIYSHDKLTPGFKPHAHLFFQIGFILLRDTVCKNQTNHPTSNSDDRQNCYFSDIIHIRPKQDSKFSGELWIFWIFWAHEILT